MAISASQVLTTMSPIPFGPYFFEKWRLTGDGSATTVTLTAAFGRRIVAVDAGAVTHDITSSTTTQVTLTFASAPGNNLTLDVNLYTLP